MIRLTTKQVISLHSALIEATGGTDVGLSLADGTMNAEKLLIWLSTHN